MEFSIGSLFAIRGLLEIKQNLKFIEVRLNEESRSYFSEK